MRVTWRHIKAARKMWFTSHRNVLSWVGVLLTTCGLTLPCRSTFSFKSLPRGLSLMACLSFTNVCNKALTVASCWSHSIRKSPLSSKKKLSIIFLGFCTGDSALKTGRWEVPGSIPCHAYRPVYSEFLISFLWYSRKYGLASLR